MKSRTPTNKRDVVVSWLSCKMTLWVSVVTVSHYEGSRWHPETLTVRQDVYGHKATYELDPSAPLTPQLEALPSKLLDFELEYDPSDTHVHGHDKPLPS